MAALFEADVEDARSLTAESVAVAERLGGALLSRGLTQLAAVAMLEGDFARTEQLAERGAVVAEAAGDDAMRAFALNLVAVGRYELGAGEEAQRLFTQSAELLRAAGDRRDLALLQGNLAGAALLEGDYARASGLYDSAIALAEEVGDRGRLPAHHQGVGIAALLGGSRDTAAVHLSAALVGAREVGDTSTVIAAVACVAGLLAARGDTAGAGALRGAADRAVADLGIQLSGSEVLVDAQLLDPAARAAGEEAWAAALAEGRSLRLDEAVDRALIALA